MNKDWERIEFLRHVRHDWLNKIQLIKGNMALNKKDRVEEIIDDIILEAQQEAKLSNLDIPAFATKILTSNWENYSFRLEYEVLNDEKCRYIEDLALTGWTSRFFSILDGSIKKYHDNHLSVSIEPQLAETRLFFDFSGIIEEKQQLIHFLQEELQDGFYVQNSEISDEELTIELLIKQHP
ncbi:MULTISPECIES: Spo0B C-terminal domain-containing protein [Bacillaceae]|uniref:Spo0B C-terminal domain-containing protein n=1 Tax=Bacillaceae TaxID=186817 RepID=UPI001E38B8AF|nr:MULTISPECIES: Spo0B C-terminal domain-containing protein [Bacillaceae]MCE4046894.1 sporulation initiation phosphotransferase B [Bacillus sp. Au-Bac7]MCM3029997.1 sporulation initiation phosphotransferase B [Niallia sp. MER 6]MDL0436291.1 Spo0B C-terminal domain-containing protein [Niallia sp. SS-2023]UPO86715.1 sporulation initiation phosphotransferase B [Niallia sp. Man26]